MKKIFFEKKFWGDLKNIFFSARKAYMQYILGPFWPKITQQIILGDFHDQDVKAWV